MAKAVVFEIIFFMGAVYKMSEYSVITVCLLLVLWLQVLCLKSCDCRQPLEMATVSQDLEEVGLENQYLPV